MSAKDHISPIPLPETVTLEGYALQNRYKITTTEYKNEETNSPPARDHGLRPAKSMQPRKVPEMKNKAKFAAPKWTPEIHATLAPIITWKSITISIRITQKIHKANPDTGISLSCNRFTANILASLPFHYPLGMTNFLGHNIIK